MATGLERAEEYVLANIMDRKIIRDEERGGIGCFWREIGRVVMEIKRNKRGMTLLWEVTHLPNAI